MSEEANDASEEIAEAAEALTDLAGDLQLPFHRWIIKLLVEKLIAPVIVPAITAAATAGVGWYLFGLPQVKTEIQTHEDVRDLVTEAMRSVEPKPDPEPEPDEPVEPPGIDDPDEPYDLGGPDEPYEPDNPGIPMPLPAPVVFENPPNRLDLKALRLRWAARRALDPSIQAQFPEELVGRELERAALRKR